MRRVFDSANVLNTVLFFDEAYALLGKRTDVADSDDRYANIEVSYLLGRMAAHSPHNIVASRPSACQGSVGQSGCFKPLTMPST